MTSVKIRANGSDNTPGDLIATLVNPATLTANSVNWFSVPAKIRLRSNQTYWIVFNEGPLQYVEYRKTALNAEDSGAATGWSIGDTHLFKSFVDDPWSTDDDEAMSVAVRGAEATGGLFGPRFDSAIVPVSGDKVVITFSEDLDISGTDLPPASAFTVKADGAAIAVQGVSATSHKTLILNVGRVILAGETVTVSYAVPDTGKVIEGAEGTDARSFTDEAVTNTLGRDRTRG